MGAHYQSIVTWSRASNWLALVWLIAMVAGPLRHTLDPLRKPAPTSSASAPRTGQAPRVTMRFDEFVAWTDAAGFGPGARSPRHVDWARIIVWSALAVVVVGVIGGGIVLATTI